MQFENLHTKFLARKIEYYKTIDSTQLEIIRRIENNTIQNGTLIYADIQTAGMGTHGRRWYTNEANNIAFSFFIQPKCKIEKTENLSLEIAKTMVEVFKKLYNITLTIKKPNDIYYNSKKIGGILTQTKVVGKIVKYIIVGIGINTVQQYFEKDIENIATSIKNEFGIDVERNKIIAEFCNLFESKIEKLMN